MTDLSSGIKPIMPTYPLRPVQPTQKDRQPGGRRKKQPATEQPARPDDSVGPDSTIEPDDKPTIDEHA